MKLFVPLTLALAASRPASAQTDRPASDSQATTKPAVTVTRKIPVLGDIPVLGNLFATQASDAATIAPSPDIAWLAPAGNEIVSAIDLKDADVSDALKSVFTTMHKNYAFADSETPHQRVTLRAEKVKLSTVLDLITQTAGLHWGVRQEKEGQVYVIGKSVQPGWNLGSNSVFQYSAPTVSRNGSSRPFTARPRYQLTKPNGSKDQSVFADPNSLKDYTVLADPNSAHLYTFGTSEDRATFTCPHCKGQVTAIQSRQQPKCPKCGRTFQSSWQFCPFDGARRPPSPATWHYCPLCGKAVDFEAASHHSAASPAAPSFYEWSSSRPYGFDGNTWLTIPSK